MKQLTMVIFLWIFPTNASLAQFESLKKIVSAEDRMEEFLVQLDSTDDDFLWTYSGLSSLDQKEGGQQYVTQVDGLVLKNRDKGWHYQMHQRSQLKDGSVTQRFEMLEVGDECFVKSYAPIGGFAPSARPVGESPNDEVLKERFMQLKPLQPFASPLSFLLSERKDFDLVKLFLRREFINSGQEDIGKPFGIWEDFTNIRSQTKVTFDDREGGLPTRMDFYLVNENGEDSKELSAFCVTCWKELSGNAWFPVTVKKFCGSKAGATEEDIEFEFVVGENYELLVEELDKRFSSAATVTALNWFEIVDTELMKIQSVGQSSQRKRAGFKASAD